MDINIFSQGLISSNLALVVFFLFCSYHTIDSIVFCQDQYATHYGAGNLDKTLGLQSLLI